MAESTKEQMKATKIACRSRQAVKTQCKALSDSVRQSLDQTDIRSDDDKESYMHKFKEVFDRVMQTNTETKGMDLNGSERDLTPEYETVDKEKEMIINEQLLPELDNLVVKVAKQRKCLPHVCYQAVRDFANSQAVYMSKVKPAAEPVNRDSLLTDAAQATCFIDNTKLRQPCATLTHLTKTVQEDKERATRLSEAISIEVSNQNSHTAAILYHGSPIKGETRQQHNVQQACKRKLEYDGRDFELCVNGTAKIAKSSSALGRDFVLRPLQI